MGVKMGWIQMGHPLARNGAALAPFRANGAHPSFISNVCVILRYSFQVHREELLLDYFYNTLSYV